jgi:hypothetical protein
MPVLEAIAPTSAAVKVALVKVASPLALVDTPVTTLPPAAADTLVITGPLDAVNVPFVDKLTPVIACPADAAEPPPGTLVRAVPLLKVATPFETDTSVITLPVDDVVTLVITGPVDALNAPLLFKATPVIAEPAVVVTVPPGKVERKLDPFVATIVPSVAVEMLVTAFPLEEFDVPIVPLVSFMPPDASDTYFAILPLLLASSTPVFLAV